METKHALDRLIFCYPVSHRKYTSAQLDFFSSARGAYPHRRLLVSLSFFLRHATARTTPCRTGFFTTGTGPETMVTGPVPIMDDTKSVGFKNLNSNSEK
jgi:hypothetical protein